MSPVQSPGVVEGGERVLRRGSRLAAHRCLVAANLIWLIRRLCSVAMHSGATKVVCSPRLGMAFGRSGCRNLRSGRGGAVSGMAKQWK